MNTIEISESVEDALQKVRPPRRGVMGSYYQTFRIRGGTSKGAAGEVVSRLVAAGWHLAGGLCMWRRLGNSRSTLSLPWCGRNRAPLSSGAICGLREWAR
jgi:hypothetical protein